MLPSLRAACDEWRPDLILRETAEYASAIAGEEHTIRHARVAVSLAAGEEQALSVAGPVVDERRPGTGERIRASPYLSLFPASLDDPQAGQPPVTHLSAIPPIGRRPRLCPPGGRMTPTRSSTSRLGA